MTMWWQQRVQFSLWDLFSKKTILQKKILYKCIFDKTWSRDNILLDSVEPRLIFCSLHWTKDLSFSWITLHQYSSQGRELYLSFPCIVEEKKRNYLTTWFIKGRVHPALGSSRGWIHTIHIKCDSQTSPVQRTSRWWCNHVMQDWFLKQKLQNSRGKESTLLKPVSKCYTLAERQK